MFFYLVYFRYVFYAYVERGVQIFTWVSAQRGLSNLYPKSRFCRHNFSSKATTFRRKRQLFVESDNFSSKATTFRRKRQLFDESDNFLSKATTFRQKRRLFVESNNIYVHIQTFFVVSTLVNSLTVKAFQGLT
jgi:hypothetical protein